MSLPKKKAKVVSEALSDFEKAGLLDGPTRERLLSHVDPLPFDWRKLARYSFIFALLSITISVGALVADDVLMELLKKVFHAPWSAKTIVLAVITTVIFVLGVERRKARPGNVFSNEAIFFVGVVGLGATIYSLGRTFDNGSGHFSVLLLLAAVLYGVVGLLVESKLIWAFSLLSLGGWFGAETGYASGWGAYYLGMAYPMRFVLFGSALTLACLLMKGRPRLEAFFGVTRVFGLLYLFISLWILSIWGNYEGYSSWHQASHFELLHWALFFGLAAVGAIYLGLKNDDGVLRGFGLTFLILNLYTKFFEIFWDNTHKAVIFGILGLSFWLLGSKAETIWQLNGLKKRVASK